MSWSKSDLMNMFLLLLISPPHSPSPPPRCYRSSSFLLSLFFLICCSCLVLLLMTEKHGGGHRRLLPCPTLPFFYPLLVSNESHLLQQRSFTFRLSWSTNHTQNQWEKPFSSIDLFIRAERELYFAHDIIFKWIWTWPCMIHFLLFWNQSDLKTIFTDDQSHMGEADSGSGLSRNSDSSWQLQNLRVHFRKQVHHTQCFGFQNTCSNLV